LALRPGSIHPACDVCADAKSAQTGAELIKKQERAARIKWLRFSPLKRHNVPVTRNRRRGMFTGGRTALLMFI